MNLLQSLLIIFAIVAIGIVCERKKVFSSTQIEGFEIFLFKIALPCFLFTETLHHDLGDLIHNNYLCSYLLSFLAIAAITFLYFHKNSSSSAICLKILACGYVNTAIYALPIITFLLGDPIAGVLSNLIQIILIQTVFITVLSFINHKEKSIVVKLSSVLTTPLVIMPIIGLVFNAAHFSPPPSMATIIETLGIGASGIALLTFGLNLGGVRIGQAYRDKNLLFVIFIKNIIHPIIAFFIGKFIFDLETYWLYSLVIATSAPTAFIVYIMAKQFAVEQNLAKMAVAVSSVFSLMLLALISLILGIN